MVLEGCNRSLFDPCSQYRKRQDHTLQKSSLAVDILIEADKDHSLLKTTIGSTRYANGESKLPFLSIVVSYNKKSLPGNSKLRLLLVILSIVSLDERVGKLVIRCFPVRLRKHHRIPQMNL